MSYELRHDNTGDDRARKVFENPLEEAAKVPWDVPGRNWTSAMLGTAVLAVVVLVFAWADA